MRGSELQKCEACSRLRSWLLECRSQPQGLRVMYTTLGVHKQWHMHQRHVLNAMSEWSITHPEDFMCIMPDGWNKERTQLPILTVLTSTSTDRSRSERLKCEMFGIDCPGQQPRRLFFTYMLDAFADNTNAYIACILKQFEVHTQDGTKPMPRNLFVFNDNASNCKNTDIQAFYGLLVKQGICSEVIMGNLPPGHTHASIDACFNVISTFSPFPTFTVSWRRNVFRTRASASIWTIFPMWRRFCRIPPQG